MEPHVIPAEDILTVYQRVGGECLAVWAAMASMVGTDGYCYPGKKDLAEKLTLSRSTVNRHVSRIEMCGLVKVEARIEEGRTLANRYQVFTPAGVAFARSVSEHALKYIACIVQGVKYTGVSGIRAVIKGGINSRSDTRLIPDLELITLDRGGINSSADTNLVSDLNGVPSRSDSTPEGGGPLPGKTRALARTYARSCSHPSSSTIVRSDPPARALGVTGEKKSKEKKREAGIPASVLLTYPLVGTDIPDVIYFMQEMGLPEGDIHKEIVNYTPGALNTAAERTRTTLMKGGNCDDARSYMFGIANKYNNPAEAPSRSLTPHVLSLAAQMVADDTLAGWALKNGRIKLVKRGANG